MLLLSAMMVFLLSGHFLAQDDTSTNITPNYCSRMGFTLWSNFTLTCSRICSPQTESLWWYLDLNLYNESHTAVVGENKETNDFEDATKVTLSLSNNKTEDSCNPGEVIEYSLTIENTRSSIDGLVVTCGVTENDNNTESLNSTVLYLKSPVTTYTTFKRTVFPGSSTTISCTRQRFRDREDDIHNHLELQQPGSKKVIIIQENAVSLTVNNFLNETGITLELTSSDTCKYDEFVNYTLTIGNINQNVDGMLITCGASSQSDTDNHDVWCADHSVELVLQVPLLTNSQFETSVANGGNFTFNCTRPCGLHIVDMWSLELEGREPFLITGKDQLEYETGVTLTLTNTENEEGCDENVVEYSLSIWNIARSMEGLTVRCGILKNDTQDMWNASHSVRLKIDNTTELEATIVHIMAQLEECKAENVAIRENINEFQATVEECKNDIKDAIVAEQEDCKHKSNTIGITVGILPPVLCTLLVLLLIFIIYRCLAKKRENTKVQGQEDQLTLKNKNLTT